MSRPLRSHLDYQSLRLIGIPDKFCDKTLDDFKTYDELDLEIVKDFVETYIDNIEQRIAENKGICFMGSNGVGKTFLSCLILKEAYRHRYNCRRITFSSYVSLCTNNWKNSDDDTFEKYKGAEFLVLEEIGKEIDSKIAKPILEDLLRTREERDLVTIICTNLTPKKLKDVYGASVCSLINGNTTVISVDSKDRRGE